MVFYYCDFFNLMHDMTPLSFKDSIDTAELTRHWTLYLQTSSSNMRQQNPQTLELTRRFINAAFPWRSYGQNVKGMQIQICKPLM